MFPPASLHRFVNAIADARAASATAALVPGFGAIGEDLRRLTEMQTRLLEEGARAEEAACGALRQLLEPADTLTTEKMAKRLVEADAVISALGQKKWLSDAHRAATWSFNNALDAYARGEGPLLAVDAARQVLSATLAAMAMLGRPLEQDEKPRKGKARTASRQFDAADYPDQDIRRAIVMMTLNGDPEATAYLENRAYKPAAGLDGRLASLIDAYRGDDADLRRQAVELGARILAGDPTSYRVETGHAAPSPPGLVPTTIGDRARIAAWGMA